MCSKGRSLVEFLGYRRRCLRGQSAETMVSRCSGAGQGQGPYVFDGDQVTGGLLDGLVDDTKTSTAQFFQHVIVVGHGGFSQGRVHCYESCAAVGVDGLGVAADRERMSLTVETGACMRVRVVWSGLLYQIVWPKSSES